MNKILRHNNLKKFIKKNFTETVTQRFKDKVIIVTGGGSGIGKATCLKAAKEGGKVVIADINEKGGRETQAEINKLMKSETLFIKTNISKEEEVEKMVKEIVNKYGKIDVLVNNAAYFNFQGLSAPLEEWFKSFMINQYGPALVTKICVEYLKKTEGSIVNIASIAGIVASENLMAYSATKAAIMQITRNMAFELSKYRIRVNSVCPGFVKTHALDEWSKEWKIDVEKLLQIARDKTLLGRAAEPNEIANAILFLASEEASYITGTYLVADGGFTTQ